MAQNKRLFLGLFLTLVIVIILGVFIFLNTRLFITGPQIDIFEPKDGSSFDSPIIEIKGATKNASFISLNDNPIFIDENGNFEEKLLLPPGISIIEFYARDKFNREISFVHQYVYKGQAVFPNSNENLLEISTSTEETIENEEEF